MHTSTNTRQIADIAAEVAWKGKRTLQKQQLCFLRAHSRVLVIAAGVYLAIIWILN